MAEANHSVHQAQVRASMGVAVMVLARQRAIKATQQQLRSQGKKPQNMRFPNTPSTCQRSTISFAQGALTR